jgi:hypothetical protein
MSMLNMPSSESKITKSLLAFAGRERSGSADHAAYTAQAACEGPVM